MRSKFFDVTKFLFLAVMFLLPVFIGGNGGSSLFPSAAAALSTENGVLTSNLFVEIAKKQNPSVVNVSVKTRVRKPGPSDRKSRPPDPFRDFYDRFFGDRNNQRPRGGMGSGFIIDQEGYILTNYHVVEGSGEIQVLLEDDKEYAATLVGADSKTDIALIKIEKKPGDKTFPVVKLGNSDNLEVGEWVVAIGNPFGLSHTVTVGVVSAKGRSIGQGPYDEFIQTDASINPGNSGGPLINIKGEVVGINTLIISGNSGGNVGIGFAIPINIAKGILKDLKEKGAVTRGWLGVMIQKITPELQESFGLKHSEGALVGDVIPGGPASAAGIKRGDVIVKFDGQNVKTMDVLPKVVAQAIPNKVVEVEVIREGKSKIINVKIEVLKDAEKVQVAQKNKLGIQVQDITPELAKSLKLDSAEGVLVSDVTAGEPAAEKGLRRGDVISEINKKPVRNMSDYNQLVGSLNQEDTVLLLVRRGATTIYIAIKLG
ncbi:MAG: DegQ family serine endoprotease [Nitrospinota bacterium]|nr:DegQ family serine endoprotease [Nitrospinota bacterium]